MEAAKSRETSFGAAAVIKLARTGDRADKGLWHARHCSLACLKSRLAGKRLDQFGRCLARMPLVINPLRRLRARKTRPARWRSPVTGIRMDNGRPRCCRAPMVLLA